MKRRKIIHIYDRSYDSYFPPNDSEYYYLAGWSGTVARQTVKYDRKYIIETWRHEREVEKPVTCEVQGIKCRLFPVKYSRHFEDWSSKMLKEIKKQAKDNEILIHHSSIHSNFLYLIAFLFRNVPIIAQHHGDKPPLMRFRQKKRISSLLKYLIEKKYLKNVDHFFVLRKKEIEYLSKFLPRSYITLQTMGVDFNEFKPIDKKQAREKLNLPENKKIILYVGRFNKLKGVDIILRTFQDLKRKYDIELILVGGSAKDPLYERVKLSEARFHGYIAHNKLPLYFSSADVYVVPAFKLYGFDVSAMEALACNVPVVSVYLQNVPFEITHQLGKIPSSGENVTKVVAEILENPESFENCREFARDYFDWKRIICRTVEVYDRLFERYYGKE